MDTKKIEAYFFLFLLLVAGYGTFLIFRPFASAILLAFIFSQLFKKWYQKTKKLLKNPSLSSLVTCLLVLLLFFAPLAIISSLVVKETNQIISQVNQDGIIERLENFSLQIPFTQIEYQNEDIQKVLGVENLTQSLKSIGNFFFEIAKKTYQGTAHFMFMAFVMTFSLYYLFKDGDRAIKKIMKLSPLEERQEKKILEKFMEISRATLKGSLIVALIQGSLVSLSFVIAGVSAATLWGVVAAILSLIPLLGAFLVWAPAGIILLIWGKFWQGFFVLLFGALVVSSIDNILRPKLVGQNSTLHPLLVFLSTLGGLAVFGMMGFLIGPIIVAFLISLLEIYEKGFRKN